MKHSMKLNFLMKSFKKSKTDEIRPYKNFNFFKLIRMKSFLSVCKHNIIISNMNNIYEGVSKITGKCFLIKMMIIFSTVNVYVDFFFFKIFY